MNRRGSSTTTRRQPRPRTAGSSANTTPFWHPGRSQTPPDDSDRRASTPTRGCASASISSINFLDDTNLSTIPSSSRGGTAGRRARDRLQELKQTKKDLERAALIAEMDAVLASVELYEEQQAVKSSNEQAKIEKLKLEMEKEEQLIKEYSYLLETIPLCIKAQTAVDKVKSRKDEVYRMLGKDSAPCSEEEVSKIRKDLETLKHSMDRVKSALMLKRISLPVLGELEKVLNQSVQHFERTSGVRQISEGMKRIATIVTLLDETVLKMEKIGDLLQEKDRLVSHLTSLRVSIMLYHYKKNMVVV